MTSRTYHVLFLCTGNSARSIMAEGILAAIGQGRFIAHSAGSMPTGRVNPFALAQLEKSGIATSNFRSKSWDEFASPDAAALDFIFTVCDNAAGEICPVWPGRPVSAHWGVSDPAAVEGSDADKARAFAEIFHQLRERIRRFVELPIEQLDAARLKQALTAIGQTGS